MELESKEEPKEEKNVPVSCNGCVIWERFGKKCYYFWEGKKHCTMWTSDWDEATMQQPL